MHQLQKTAHFTKKASKFVKSDQSLRKKLTKSLQKLKSDPFQPPLKNHKVNSRLFGHKWSSRVSGDIRITWDFSEQNTIIILLLDIGSQTGRKRVYN